MIPLFNIAFVGGVLFCLGCTLKIYLAYRKSKSEILTSLLKVFIFSTFAYTALSLPNLILFSSFWIQVDFIFSNIFFYLTHIYMWLIIFGYTNQIRFKKTLFYIGFTWIIINVLLNIFLFNPAIPLITNKNVYYWQKGTPLLFQFIENGITVFMGFALASFYFNAMKSFKEKTVRMRLLFFGLGLIFASIGGFIFYFFPHSFNLLVLSGFLGLFEWLFIFLGVFYFVPPRERYVKKID